MSKIMVYRAHGDALEQMPVEADTLDDATLRTGHGVYTVMRTYPGIKVVRMAQHYQRLGESARLLGVPFKLDEEWIRQALRRAIEASHFELARARLTVPFGSPDTLILALESFSPPAPELYATGVRVGLVEGRRESPLAKDSHFIEWRKALLADQPPGIFEIILYDGDSLISEGVGSNFYGVIDGKLRTAADGMLEGIARSILLDVVAQVIPIELRRIRVDELKIASEAMLTSASRSVIPVVQVGDVTIGDGKPGPVAAALKAKYDHRLERELEPL
jgi:branched-chain amino acid aminotransferase